MASSLSKPTLNDYAYMLFCEEYYQHEISPSLKVLSQITGKTPPSGAREDRHSDINFIIRDLPPQKKEAVLLLESAGEGFYAISRDTDDEEYILQTYAHLEKSLSLFKPNTPQNITIRDQIFNRIYDLDEQLHPGNPQKRFNLLKQMVRDIKNNDGRYDFNPLNITARRIGYEMKHISAKSRLQLMLEIKKKTIDSEQYNYSRQIADLENAYRLERAQEREDLRLANQERYQQIREKDLPEATTPEKRIPLYLELMNLINDQDWSRGRKFSEKKTICNHLIDLYTQTGDQAGLQEACKLRQKYIEASDRCIEAARRKGYYSRS